MPKELTPLQQQAIALLLQGKTQTETARELGIDRSTLWSWKTKDPVFIAELNRQQAEIYEQAINRLRGLVAKAINVLERALEQGDEKLAIKVAFYVLKTALNEMTPQDPVTPEEVEQRFAWKELFDQPFFPELR